MTVASDYSELLTPLLSSGNISSPESLLRLIVAAMDTYFGDRAFPRLSITLATNALADAIDKKRIKCLR